MAGHFDNRYAVRIRIAATRHREQNRYWTDRTTTLDAWLEGGWTRRVHDIEVEAGPVVGYARVSRPVYGAPVNGFLAGAGVGAMRSKAARFGVVVRVTATLSSFSNPSTVAVGPPGFSNHVDGNRLVAGMGLTYSWLR